MTLRHSFRFLLCAAVSAGALAGFLLGRPRGAGETLKPDIAGEHETGTVASHARAITGLRENAIPVHTTEELSEWLERARELCEAGGLGFDAVVDAPHLFLALERLTAADFPLLMERLAAPPDNESRHRLQELVLDEWSRRFPREAVAWARENRPDKYVEALKTLARTDGAAAWEERRARPPERDNDGEPDRTIFTQWARQNRAAALEALLALAGTDELGAGMGFYSAMPDRETALEEWASARDFVAQTILERLKGRARMGALSALLSHMQELRPHAAEPAALAGERDALAGWLRSLSLPEEEQTQLLTSIAQHHGCTPEGAPDAFPWLWREAPKSGRAEVLKEIVEYWASEEPWSAKDPDACGRWLNEVNPSGQEYDPALKAFAVHAAGRDPEAGLAWAEKVSAPAARLEARSAVRAVILKQWPHRAEELGVHP